MTQISLLFKRLCTNLPFVGGVLSFFLLLLAYPLTTWAISSTSVTKSVDFSRGLYTNTESISKEGELKLNASGTWEARVWKTPYQALNDGTIVTSDSEYTYMLTARDTRFIKYIPGEDKWKTLTAAPHTPYSGAEMVVMGNDIYVTFGGFQKFFSKYSITNNTWTDLTALPEMVSSGSSMQTDGTSVYVLRGGGTTDFWKYNTATNTFSTMTAPPATIAAGADFIFDDSTGTSYLYTPRGTSTVTFYRYDIVANTWSSMTNAPATLGDNGNLTKSGGYIYVLRGANTQTMYRYSIAGNSWSTMANTPAATRYVGLTYNAADSDYLYVYRGNATYDWWKYRISDDTYVGPVDLPAAPGTGADLNYSNGHIYYRRGNSTASFYRLNLSVGSTWATLPNAPATFADDTKGIVAGTAIYYLRGSNTNTFYRYNITAGTWVTSGTAPATANSGASLAYPGSGDYIYGTRGGVTTSFWRYSISGDLWSDAAVADLPTDNEAGIGSRIISDGTDIYAITGTGIANLLKYTVGTNTWSSLGAVPFTPYYGTDVVFYNGNIYAQSGLYKTTIWAYSISGGTWRRLGDMPGYYVNDIGPYNGGSLVTDSTNGVLYSISGSNLTRLLAFTPSANNYPTSGTWTSDTFDLTYVSSWGTFLSSSSAPGDSTITFESRTSADKVTWTGWGNIASGTISSTAQRYIQIKATLNASTDQTQTPTLYSITVQYNGDTTDPTNPSSVTGLSQSVGGVSISSGSSYPHANPYFSWSGATDAQSSVSGYYAYFGTNASADPESDGNFQTASTYTVTTPMTTGSYYLRLKTKDTAGNISDATTAFTYAYNGVSPPQTSLYSTSVHFASGTGTNISTSGDEIKLASKAGFWEQKRLTTIPLGVSYGTGFAYVSSTDKLYTFRGNNTTTFYEYAVATDTWTAMAVAPAAVQTGGDLIEGPSGYLYGMPGRGLNTFWRYDIAGNSWSDAAAADAPLSFNTGASLIYDGSRYIYALRGNSDDSFMRYDTTDDTWDLMTNTDFGAPADRPNNLVGAGGELAYDRSDTIYAIQGSTYTGFSAYNIESNAWTILTDLPVMANDGAQISYDEDTNAIYYVAGWTTPFMYKYDISSQTWTALADAPATISAGGAIRNIDGIMYILRGAGTTTFWKYDVAKASWQLPNMGMFGVEFRGTDYRPFGTGADIVKGDGTYYYLVRGNFDNQFARYDASSGETTLMADAPAGFTTGATLAYDDDNNKIYAIASQYVRELYVYDIATDTWSSEASDQPPLDAGAGSSLVYDGSQYLYWTRGASTTTFYRFDTQGSSGTKWSTRAVTPATIGAGGEIVHKSGYIYAVRGLTQLGFYRYDPNANTWNDVSYADLPSGVTIGADGFLVDGGGDLLFACRGLNTVTCYQYSITGNSWTIIENAPANINAGGAAASNRSDRIFVIPGTGTNTYANGLYSYVPSTTTSAFQESGSYESPAHDLGSVYKYANITVTYASATNASLTVYSQSSADDSDYSSWTEASEVKSNGSSYVYKFNSPSNRYIKVKFTLTSSDGIYSGAVQDYTLNYYQDTDAPTNPSSLTGYVSVGSTGTLTTNTWYSGTAPYFDWPDADAVGGATDTATGSGIEGYYVYFGVDSTANPVTSGLLLTTSASTVPSLTSGLTYYLRIKTIDSADNVSSATWAPFIYKLDTTAPTNPSTIVSDPAGYSATNSFSFSWSGAADAESGLASYCYKTGEVDATETCTSSTSVTGITGYTTGSNTFSVRARDTAGNYAGSYATASYYYSATAPGAPEDLEVTPSTNTVNEFAFSWAPPETYSGAQSGLRYYYSVNAHPTSSNVNTVGLSNAYLTASSYATQNGSNIFYVVAKDEAGNIDYNNYATVTFTANTSAPGIPLNTEIADVSVKETESWKLAVSWEPPASTGSGLSQYKVYRSVIEGASCTSDMDDFTYVSSTTGKSFVDTDLEQETHYYCVKACTSTNECSAPSDTVSFLPDGRWKVSPSLTAEPTSTVKTRTATITWSTGRKASSFVKYGKSSGDYGTEVGSSELETAHEIEILSIDPGTTYYYKVLWTDEDGNTGESDEYTFTTNAAPFVSSVKFSNISLDQSFVNFTVSNATKATVQYGKTSSYGAIETVSTSKAESTYTVNLKSLTDGTLYHVRIVAEDEEGNTYNGDDYTFETLPVPKLANLRVQQVDGMPTATLRLIWVSNTRLSSIVTYYPTGRPELSKDYVNLTPKLTHEVILKDMLDETEYVLLVKGKDSAGNEGRAESKTIKTASDLRPPEVLNASVESTIVGVGEDARAQVLITWDTDEPATSQVEYATGTSGQYTTSSQEDPSMTTNHSVTIPGLAPSKIYHFRIISKDKNKNIGYSQDTVVITPNATADALNLVVNKLSKTFGFLKKTKLN